MQRGGCGRDLVDFAGRQVVVPGEGDVQEALIVAQVQVHLQQPAH